MNTNLKISPRAARYLLEGTAVLSLALLTALVAMLHITRPPLAYSEQVATLEETVQARVLAVLREDSQPTPDGMVMVAQELTLEILSRGDFEGQRVTVTYNGMGTTLDTARFREGQRALMMIAQRPDGQTFYQMADKVRLWPLAIIGALFVGITAAVGRWQGLRALIGLGLSGALIGGFVLPQILAHRDPVTVALAGMALLLAVTLYLIQGWNVIGHTATLSMLASLGFTGLLAVLWTRFTFLTGFGSEETMFLQAVGVTLDMRGLLLAGMIIGAAGVLDDVVLAQAVTVFELARANPLSPWRRLYRQGMKVGVAHLASMVNTLVMAYASTALPLFILFYLYPEPWYLTINRELIAEEIIRTLVGSTGLMLAVPFTTLVAAVVAVTQTPPRPATPASETGDA